MSTGTSDEGPAGNEPSPAEVERLRVENERLAAEVERVRSAPERRHRTRKILTPIVVVLTVIALVAAVPGTWVRRTFVDQDRYVATVSTIAEDPAVQDYLARQITLQTFQALGVEDRIGSVLQDEAPRLAFLAGPITSAIEGFVQDEVGDLVASEQFQTLWVSANAFAHQAVIDVLEGGGDTVMVQDGVVTINLLPIVNEALTRVSEVASELVGRPITLPTITADTFTPEQLDALRTKVEDATGVTLPEDFGQITVFRSAELGAAQDAFRWFNSGVILLVLLFVIGFAAAIALSVRRRRTLLQLLTASAVVVVVERRLAVASVDDLVQQARPENRDAFQAVLDTLLGTLLRYTGWLLLIALVAIVITLITGPYGWAVRLRRAVADLAGAIGGAVQGADRSQAAEWVAARRDPLMFAGAVVAILILLVVSTSIPVFLVVAALLALYEFGVFRVAAGVEAQRLAADGGESPASSDA
jgi:hypothetical protein